MVERVARAAGITPEQARAAIAAMREPTDAMMDVQDHVTYLRDMWPAMIDAGLSDEG